MSQPKARPMREGRPLRSSVFICERVTLVGSRAREGGLMEERASTEGRRPLGLIKKALQLPIYR
jgi:hypothetical protein